MEFFLCNKHKIAKIANTALPCRHRLLGQNTKQQLSNFEPQKAWKYKQLWGLSPDPSYL